MRNISAADNPPARSLARAHPIPPPHAGEGRGGGNQGKGARTALAWATTPTRAVLVLILATLLVRLVFADSLGLGIDESYMVAAGRKLQLSYFDHPPIAWWMASGIAHLTGSENAIVVRLPFVALFAFTTWLMYRLTSVLFDPASGLWAAVVLNLAPVFGVTAGSWVLPDGPLFAALLGAAVCLVTGLRSESRAAWGWWSAAGGCAGLALCAKYSAVLTLAGAVIFLATEPKSRHWLLRPHPYLAGAIALAIFLPVIIWNAKHGWVSFLFQASRPGGPLHPWGPVLALAGHAAFLLPWIWGPLLWCGVTALRRGPADAESWLLVCLAAPPILAFTVAALRGNTLFHWAAPGYLMLLPLFGQAIAHKWQSCRLVRAWLAVTATFVVVGLLLVVAEVRYNWFPRLPNRDVVDWTSLRTELASRGLLDRPGLVAATLKWYDAGKLDYALGGQIPVICLGPDPRQYGVIARPDDYAGADAVIAAPHRSAAQIDAELGPLFDRIEPAAPATIMNGGRPLMELPLFIGHNLHRSAADYRRSQE
jgi:Dolichyl-phosphate-mannose-protein mannosyltransferase